MNEETAKEGREIEEQKWELPEKFRLTEENHDAIKRQERIWANRSVSPFAQQSPLDFERARSVRIAEELRVTLADVDRRIGAAITTGGAELEQLQADRRALRHQLAGRYAIFGRYDLAAELEPE